MQTILQFILWPILQRVGTEVLIDVLKYAIRVLEQDDGNDINKDDVDHIDSRLNKK